MKFKIFPYKVGSNSASQLAQALGCKQIKHEGSGFNKWNDPKYWIINWGSSRCPSGHSVLNPSINTIRAGNKLQFFDLVKDYCRIPDYTTDKEVAKTWFDKSKMVVGRQTLTGHSGQGIVIYESPEAIQDCPLYVRYIPKDAEYRLHFIAGKQEPFFIQRKAKKKDFEGEPNRRVRNLSNGYVYVHEPENVGEVPQDVITQCVAAFNHSHLDFTAIDCIFNRSSNKAYVLEANSAPGLCGETVLKYKEAFMGIVK